MWGPMTNRTVASNYLYSILNQAAILLLPLMTIPYLSCVLRSHGIGQFAFTHAIARYVLLLSSAGIAAYGQRSVAYVQHDTAERTAVFWQVFTLQCCVAGGLLCLYLPTVLLVAVSPYRTLLLLWTVFLVASAIDINWFFMGIEHFDKPVKRTLFVRVALTALIFLFVRNPTDVWKHVLLHGSSFLVGNAVMWTLIPRYVRLVPIDFATVRQHFRQLLPILLPTFLVGATPLYGKTVLGMLSTASEVGIYELGTRIPVTLLPFLTALSVVMLPRVSNVFAQGQMNKVRKYAGRSLTFSLFLALPMTTGLIITAPTLIPWFLGPGYERSVYVLMISAPTVTIWSTGAFLGNQLCLPLGKQRLYLVANVFGTVAIVLLMVLLIPRWGALGACTGAVLGQLLLVVTMGSGVKEYVIVPEVLREATRFVTGCLVMATPVALLGQLRFPGPVVTLCQLVVGAAVYLLSISILGSDMVGATYGKLLTVMSPQANRSEGVS